jgi:hypothetical protein
MFGPIDKVSFEDMHRLMDTDFWGVVYGSRAAVDHRETAGDPGGSGKLRACWPARGSTPGQSSSGSLAGALPGAFSSCLRLRSMRASSPSSWVVSREGAVFQDSSRGSWRGGRSEDPLLLLLAMT